ncbi:hypothetical protein [Alishewanella tabrizica]|uniref:Uncharacterized protein n=1 Tax=Alishewanella tabrizica TaxID=671278 RepID=A0ABQ2WI74_9ALTE|nr:hypothetical protein [Alishewanella tabrizica]GGW57766.1 hypothetical protein GCM10008111_12360 [Alishewanella tabrizica]
MPEGTKRDIEQVKQLQSQISTMQKQLGWTLVQLGQAIYCELHEDDDDEERITKFCEALKKQLKRSTTPVELLQRYIQIMCNDEDFRRAEFVVQSPIRLGTVDINILRKISEISRNAFQDE